MSTKMHPDENNFYTVSELAKILKVHENTVRSAIKSGHLPHVRLGVGRLSHIRISVKAFEDWVQTETYG